MHYFEALNIMELSHCHEAPKLQLRTLLNNVLN